MITRLLSGLREHRWLWALSTALIVAIVVTAALRLYAVRAVEANVDARQEQVVRSTLSTLEDRFDRLQQRLAARASQVAENSIVVNGLCQWRDSGHVSSDLVEVLSRRASRSYTAIEVYSPARRLVAWKGLQMPLDSSRAEDRDVRRLQTTVVTDEDGRRAVTLWHPVTSDGQLLGAVRVVRVVAYHPPVQNRYVQAISLEGRWARDTGELVRIRWEVDGRTNPHRVLRGADGRVLGHVTVARPPPERLVERTASLYADLLAVWGGLLVALCVGVAAGWYLRLGRRSGLRRHRGARQAAAQRLATFIVLAIAARYVFLLLDVPGRWAPPGSSLAPLFDPTHFASAIAGGVLRSIGDLLLTGIWAAGMGAGLLHLGRHYRPSATSVADLLDQLHHARPRAPHAGRYLGTIVLMVAGSLGGLVGVAHVVRRAVLDSTLDFFSRTGFLPEPLVLGVLCGLFLLLAGGLLAAVGGFWIGTRRLLESRPRRWPGSTTLGLGLVSFAAAISTLYLSTGIESVVSLPYTVIALVALGACGTYGLVRGSERGTMLTLRGLLTGVFATTILLYPLLYAGMDAKRKEHMVDAAQSFEQAQDPRVLYSLRRLLRSASERLGPLFAAGEPADRPRIDSVATALVRESLLASLPTYDVELSVLGSEGEVHTQYSPSGKIRRASSARVAQSAFSALRSVYEESPGLVVEQFTQGDRAGGTRAGRYAYAGLLGFPVQPDSTRYLVLARVEPQSLLPGTEFGVPRVLLPDGSFGDLYANLSLAEYRGGQLVRSFGADFGRTQLRSGLQLGEDASPSVWREDVVRGRRYLTYYERVVSETDDSASIVAVRIPAILGFDHLYYLLRLTVAGLFVGLLVYLLGLYLRYRQGRLPAKRVRFRNKVLNAFLVVGIVSMGAVGVFGVQVVTGENDRVIERRIQEDLSRIEQTLALEATPDEPLWRVADRIDVDSLAAQVGLDLHLYRNHTLQRTSQPGLVRDGLVDERLPGDVYHALYDQSYHFVIDEAAIGQFGFRVGYKALLGEDGRPRVVVAVPTLAQQEQLQEEQSRTLAYLFGALLLLVVVVMLTGVVLANALAQPIAQLREGLEAVGKGRYARTLTVDTRDEIGDLVETFNEMRDQLAESRRKLARQERELAWREMARQVAHEIKNPLTPMKLSIQHLRRAFESTDDAEKSSEFAEVFDRITSTLIEQVESLVRIADEFSTFARLPTRVTEPVNLNEVIREAVSLMEQETSAAGAIELDLCEGPVVVEADREELRRTYINLLKNALQAIPEGRDGCVRVQTECARREEGPLVQSRVSDNGTGIPADLQSKIFDPNFSTKTSGTGLGLAIAQKSIEELGGEIGFETAEGEGTTFWIDLPLSEEEAAA